jgi:hypothetical protein
MLENSRRESRSSCGGGASVRRHQVEQVPAIGFVADAGEVHLYRKKNAPHPVVYRSRNVALRMHQAVLANCFGDTRGPFRARCLALR